nr:hypothetical protein [Deltaproteobacteria bacterium]
MPSERKPARVTASTERRAEATSGRPRAKPARRIQMNTGGLLSETSE